MQNTQNDHSDHHLSPAQRSQPMVGVTEARRNFGELIDKVRYQQEVVVLEKAGRPAAAIIPYELLQEWLPDSSASRDTRTSSEPFNLEDAFGSVAPITTPGKQEKIQRVIRQSRVEALERGE